MLTRSNACLLLGQADLQLVGMPPCFDRFKLMAALGPQSLAGSSGRNLGRCGCAQCYPWYDVASGLSGEHEEGACHKYQRPRVGALVASQLRGGCGALWWVEQQTRRRGTAKEASTDGIGCVGWIQMVRRCAANPSMFIGGRGVESSSSSNPQAPEFDRNTSGRHR